MLADVKEVRSVMTPNYHARTVGSGPGLSPDDFGSKDAGVACRARRSSRVMRVQDEAKSKVGCKKRETSADMFVLSSPLRINNLVTDSKPGPPWNIDDIQVIHSKGMITDDRSDVLRSSQQVQEILSIHLSDYNISARSGRFGPKIRKEVRYRFSMFANGIWSCDGHGYASPVHLGRSKRASKRPCRPSLASSQSRSSVGGPSTQSAISMIQEALDGKDLEAMAVEGVGAVTATVAGIMVVVGRRGSG